MNKLLTKIIGVTLGLGLATGVGAGVIAGNKSVEPAYAAQTYLLEETSVSIGDTIVIACNSNELSGVSGSNIGTYSAFTGNPTGAYALDVVSGKSTNTVALKNGTSYLSWTSGNNLYTSTTLDNNSSWTISFSNGIPTIANAADNSRKIKWNAGSPRFACYTSAQTNVQIYKLTTVIEGAVTGVELDNSFVVSASSSLTLTETISPSNATNKNVTWTSSNTNVATVSASGVVTKVAGGYSIITVETEDGGFTASCTVVFASHTGAENDTLTVADAVLVANATGTTATTSKYYIGGTVSSMSITANSYATGVITDGTNTFNLYRFYDVGPGNVNFTDTSKIQVTDDIVVYGTIVKYNNTTPQSAYGNLVSVESHAISLSVSKDSVSINIGDEDTITATLTNASDTENIAWETDSGNESIISLSSASGTSVTITGVSAGEETLICSYGLLEEEILVTVTDPNAPNEGTITFGNNGTKINSASVSGNDSLNKTWTITTTGTTSFTQSTDYSQVGKSAEPAETIAMTMSLGDTFNVATFSAKFGGFNSTVGDISLKVGTTEVGNGSLSGTSDVVVNSTSIASGSSLTVEVSNIAKGVKVYYISYSITQSAISSVDVESVDIGDDISIAKGNKQQLTPIVLPADATNKNVTWESDDEDVAIVNESGLITAVDLGTANITCKSVDNPTIKDTIVVTVTSAVLKSLSIANSNKAFVLGATLGSHFTDTTNIIKAILTDGTQIVKTINDVTIKIGTESVTASHLMSLDDVGKKVELTYTEDNISTKSSLTDITVASSENATSFATTFLSTLSTDNDAVCDADGATDLGDLQAAWGLLAESFGSLTPAEKSVFVNATANESGNDIEKAVALYDYIASKYNTELQTQELTNYNFMGRSITPSGAKTIMAFNNDSSTIMTIVIIAIVMTTSTGAIFLLRKKKEER